MNRRAAVLRVTPELLLTALHLPEDIKLCSAQLDCYSYVIELVIEHESLPETAEGDLIPKVKANFVTHFQDGHAPFVEFKGFIS